jgi:hypothetical protein
LDGATRGASTAGHRSRVRGRGFPVTPIAAAAQKERIAYIGMLNEQAASYAAQACGYLGAASVPASS